MDSINVYVYHLPLNHLDLGGYEQKRLIWKELILIIRDKLGKGI